MAFINLIEAYPKKVGFFRVMVDAVGMRSYEAIAKWSSAEGSELIGVKMEDDAYIASWWWEDNKIQ